MWSREGLWGAATQPERGKGRNKPAREWKKSMDKVLEEGQSPVCLRPCKTAVWNLARGHRGQSWHRLPWARAGVAGFYSSCGGKSWSCKARVVGVCCNPCPSVLSPFSHVEFPIPSAQLCYVEDRRSRNALCPSSGGGQHSPFRSF